MPHHIPALLLLLALAPALGAAAPASEDAALVKAREFLARNLLLDGHNDLPWALRTDNEALGDIAKYDLRKPTRGDTDLARLRAGGVGGQFWSVYIPGELGGGFARTQLEQIELARRIIARYPEALGFARTADEVEAEYRAGRIASLLGIEGGHAIENSLGTLRAYHALGVRYMTLTHNTHTDWADAAAQVPARHDGLTDFGRAVVREMNRIGMLVDIAHTAPATMHDALDTTAAPVIFSHANARAIANHPRNVPDDVLRRLPANGGVIMITFVGGFVSEEVARITLPAFGRFQLRVQGVSDPAERKKIYDEVFGSLKLPKITIGEVADHIEHVRKVASVDNIGIGGDFDGNELWPEGLSDVSMYPNLIAELIRRGWSEPDLAKLAGGNVLRALRGAEAVAARLQAGQPDPPVVVMPTAKPAG
jgi:membrane dipeptidase